jgi:DNA-binding CsgD family transcriptional regulator
MPEQGVRARARRRDPASLARRAEHPALGAPRILRCAALAHNDPLRRLYGAARAIVYVTDPAETLSLDRAVLRQLFGLTPAEAALADLLCGGERLADAASALGITQNTARAQLKSVFQKTGATRQAELVKLLLALSAYR